MLSKLIEALQIFLKYGDVRHPTHCDDETLLVCVDPKKVSEEDKERLKTLGFHETDDGFYSTRYGSA